MVRFLGGVKNFYLFQNSRIDSEAYPVPGVRFQGFKRSGRKDDPFISIWRRGLKMHGAITSLSPYAFVACSGDNLLFFWDVTLRGQKVDRFGDTSRLRHVP